jgi:pimeloyl-ACP methyl ester carboxylesterase
MSFLLRERAPRLRTQLQVHQSAPLSADPTCVREHLRPIFVLRPMANKKSDLPRKGDIIQVGSHQVHILSSGNMSDPAIIMLHGCGSLAEELVIPFENEGLRLIAPDRPGYGFSSPLGIGSRGPISQSFWLEDLLEQLGVTQVLIAAHSLGSATALHLAARRPDMVKGMMLISPCCRPVPFKPFIVLRTAVAPLVGDVVRRHVIGRWPDFFLDKGLRSSSFPNALPANLERLPADHVVSPASIQTMADELKAFNRT